MASPAYRRSYYRKQPARHQVSASRLGAPFGYVTIEHQCDVVVVEHAGERRVFNPGQDLADFLDGLLGQPLGIRVISSRLDVLK